MSADFSISFLYFLSGFIGTFAIIKRFEKTNENLNSFKRLSNPSYALNENENFLSELTFKSVIQLICERWLRLAFPTYLMITVTQAMIKYSSYGPVYAYYCQEKLIDNLNDYWWSYITMVSNL